MLLEVEDDILNSSDIYIMEYFSATKAQLFCFRFRYHPPPALPCDKSIACANFGLKCWLNIRLRSECNYFPLYHYLGIRFIYLYFRTDRIPFVRTN